jgi:hypothetical protein
METFSPEIHDKIGYYVYRLIDPRNGQTFYVGKGRGNRIFQRVQGALKQEEVSDEDEMDLKNTTILGIKHVGLSVIHVIHRHGIKSDVEQIKSAYAAEPLVAKEPLILICVSRSLAEGRETYDAVRGIWKMARKEAEKRALVLAYDGLLVIGAYRPEKWLVGTKSNFPFVKEDHPDRIGFVGAPAKDVWADYVGKRVPARHKGAIGPFRYLAPGRSGEPEDLDS